VCSSDLCITHLPAYLQNTSLGYEKFPLLSLVHWTFS
jgi:hypothetical protein